MPVSQLIQSSFTSGVFSPTLARRFDVAKYYNALKTGKNITLMPHGGAKRRAGTRPVLKSDDYSLGYAAQELYFSNKVRIEEFVFNTSQKYLIVFEIDKITIIKGLLKLTSFVPTFTFTDEQLTECDITQFGDSMIIVHPDLPPMRLLRGATELDWSIDDIQFENIPIYDYTKNVSGSSEIFTGDGSTKEFTFQYGDAPFTAYVNGVKQTKPSNYSYNDEARVITFSLAPADNAKIEIVSGKGITKQDIDSPYEPLWSDTRGYPKSVAIYQGRLYFGGTKSKPISIFGSVVNDEFNFQIGEGADNDGIFDTLSSGFDHIVNIHAGRSLQIFTESGEYYNSASVITPATSGYLRQTSYGSVKIRNIDIDGATYFVDRSANAIRKFVYSFNEDAYVSENIALLANHLFNDITSIAVSKGTGRDVANLVYAVNGDGTMAVLNTLKLEDVQGWSEWTTAGTYEDVAVVDRDVYLLVNRNGKKYIEMVDEDVLMDHYTSIDDTNSFLVLPTSASIGFTEMSKRGDGFYDGVATNYEDGDLLKVNFPTTHKFKEIGFNFKVELETMDLNVNTKTGQIINAKKRIVKIKVHVYETLGITIQNNRIIDRQFIMNFDNQLPAYTGLKETFVQGYADSNSIVITQDIPMPFTLLMLEAEIKY